MTKIGRWKKQHKSEKGIKLFHWSQEGIKGQPTRNLIYSYENNLWHHLADSGNSKGAYVLQTFRTKKAVKRDAIMQMRQR